MIDPLLKIYVQTQSPGAFKALVDRHGNAVYAQCVRQLRDPHLAEDVTQTVFMVLASKAKSLPENVVLAAWLFKVTRYACANAQRSEIRRKHHEREAAMRRDDRQQSPEAKMPGDMDLVLDDALARLGRADRQAILLRYYTGMNAAQVGENLGLSQEIAKRRITRAVQKLRQILQRRGITLSATVLIARLDSLPTGAAPAHLAQAILTSALNPSVNPWCAGGAKGVICMMLWTQIKSGLAAALLILIGTGGLAIRGVLAQTAPSTQVSTAPDANDQAIDRALIRTSIEKVAKAIRSNDLQTFNQYVSFANDNDGALVRGMLLENIAYRHLQTAWEAKFQQPPNTGGFGFVWFGTSQGGAEILLERTLENLSDSQIIIVGNSARIHLMSASFDRGQELNGWRGRWLVLTNDGVTWKIETSQLFRIIVSMTFRAGKLPLSSEEESQIALQQKLNAGKILDAVAQAIESGAVTAPRQAATRIENELKAMQSGYGLAGLGYSFTPARPISLEVGD